MMKIKGNCLVVNKKQHIVAAPQGSGLHGEQKKSHTVDLPLDGPAVSPFRRNNQRQATLPF